MKKLIKVITIISLLCSLQANSNHLTLHKNIINSDSDKILKMLYNPNTTLESAFELALYSGSYSHLNALNDGKFKFPGQKGKINIKNIINSPLDPQTDDAPLHLIVQITAYHRKKTYEHPEKNTHEYIFHLKKYHDALKTLYFLIEHGAEVDIINRKGQTPLHLACKEQDYEAANILLNAFADPRIQDNKELLPLDYLDSGKISPRNYQKWMTNLNSQRIKRPSCLEILMAVMFGTPSAKVHIGS